ncbi:MAG: outer membrane beta-barrel protein [Bacteroidia bacterium]
MEKKIKIQFAIAVILTLLTAQVYSQGIYFAVSAGYGLPAAPNAFKASNYSYTLNSTGHTSSFEIVKGTGSFGKGFQAGGTFGYMFNENVGAELGLSYLSGADMTGNYSESNSSTTFPHSSTQENTLSGNMLRISPALKIAAGEGKIKPYMKAGLVVGMSPKVIETSFRTDINNGIGSKTEMEIVYSGGTPIGFTGSLGADFKLNDRISIFFEFNMIAQSWAPKKGIMTKYTEDGVDQLPDMDTNEKEVEFVDSYTESSSTNNTYNAQSPSKELKVFLPFSSAGAKVGLQFALGKQSK